VASKSIIKGHAAITLAAYEILIWGRTHTNIVTITSRIVLEV